MVPRTSRFSLAAVLLVGALLVVSAACGDGDRRGGNSERDEGREEAERIRANADREVQVILAEAERDGQITRGEGDARSTEIYANAYGQDEEFFAFYRSLRAYGNSFGGSQDVMVLDPSSSFFDYFGSDSAER